MERNKSNDAGGDFAEGDADMVESAGETTAAATGSSEIGAVVGEAAEKGAGVEAPVGADTMIKVAGESVAEENK
jgi:hypothetical protein